MEDNYGTDRLLRMLDIASDDHDEWYQWAVEELGPNIDREHAYELFLLRRFVNGVGAIAFLLLRHDDYVLDRWRDY